VSGTELLATIRDAISAALPGWQVVDYPLPDTSHPDRTVEVVMGGASFTGYALASPGLREEVRIALSVTTNPHPDRYRELVDARDAVVLALHEARGPLLAQGVELGPPAVLPATMEAPGPSSGSDSRVFWRLVLSVSVSRRLE